MQSYDNDNRLWRDVDRELTELVVNMKGESYYILVEPPFILALKALLKVSGNRWAEMWKDI